jgi:hypothetical protein
LSVGLLETNQLWNADSGKHSPGYIIFAAHEGSCGLDKSIMISGKLLDEWSYDQLDGKKQQWAGGWS